MIKRIWKANPVFTFLFLLSFTLTFSIAYYGMSLKGQLQTVEQTADKMDYGYRGSLMVEEREGPVGKKMPGLDSGIICYMVSVRYEDVMEQKSAYVVMEMNDPMLEPLAEGESFLNGKEYSMPQCICGMAWKKYIKEDGAKKLLSVNGWDYEVTGILEPNGYQDSDWRLFLYGPSLPEKCMEELFDMNIFFVVDYRTAEEGSADIQKFNEWVQKDFNNPEVVENMERVDGSIDVEFQDLMSGYQIFFICMMVFCFLDCAFLTYVWCTQRLRANMVKRVFGFSMGRIWLEGILEIIIYEAASLLLAGVFCLIVEAVRGNVAAFWLAWQHGAGLMGNVVLLFTLPLSVINILYLQNIKPADTLKAAE